jgi:hypothetical protein
VEVRRIEVCGYPKGTRGRSYLKKQRKQKGLGVVGQVEEHLPGKLKT